MYKRGYRKRAPVKRRKPPGKRVYRKRYTPNRMKIMKCPSAMPNKMKVKLRICSFGNLTITGTAITFQMYGAARPIRDSWGTPIPAIDPQGLDQWKEFYSRYRVTRMSYKFTLGRISNDATAGLVRILDNWSNSTTAPGVGTYYNDRYTKIRHLSSNSGVVSYRKIVRPWVVLGLKYSEWYNDFTTTAETKNQTTPSTPSVPGSLPYGYIQLSSPGNLSVVVDYSWVCDLYFELFEPRLLVDV